MCTPARRAGATRRLTVIRGLCPVLLATLLSLAAARTSAAADAGQLRVVELSGTPYDIGRQHGVALREDIRGTLRDVLGYFRKALKVPLVRRLVVNWWLDRTWRAARPFVARRFLEELQGVADGAGVPLRDVYRLHAIPDRTYTCANFAAWGRATREGRLVHARNLDWTIRAGAQRHAVVLVVRPAGRHAFLSVGWAGFIGVLTGVSDAQISIGQIGAETADVTYAGEPMVFLMRRVLEESGGLEDAVDLLEQAPRTVGVNYVVADAQARRAVAVETTRHHVRVFAADDPLEHAVTSARPLEDVVVRADTAFDPEIRARQRASGGNPRRPGLEPPTGSAYTVRYLGQVEAIRGAYGRLDAAAAQEIAQRVAPDSNVQSVIFAWPDVWVANAQELIPAAQRDYQHLNAGVLLSD